MKLILANEKLFTNILRTFTIMSEYFLFSFKFYHLTNDKEVDIYVLDDKSAHGSHGEKSFSFLFYSKTNSLYLLHDQKIL